MATHSSVLAWRIPGMGEPGGLPSVGLHRVGRDWSSLAAVAAAAEYIIWNAGLDEAQAGIKIARRNINNLRYADDTTLRAESEDKLKNLLMKVKEESEKVGLKLNTQQTKITASGPITSWQIDGESGETMTDFIWGGSKITADGDCSHEIKILTPWKETYDQPRPHVKKQRHYFVNKGPFGLGYRFFSSHVWMWELDCKESWTFKTWSLGKLQISSLS